MASISELIQLANFQNQNQPGQELPNMLNTGVQGFQGGIDTAKAEDEKLLDRTVKFLAIQKAMREAQQQQAMMEEARKKERGQAFAGAFSGDKDNSSAGKTTNILQDMASGLPNSPAGRQLGKLYEGAKNFTPQGEFSEMGPSGITFKAVDKNKSVLDNQKIRQGEVDIEKGKQEIENKKSLIKARDSKVSTAKSKFGEYKWSQAIDDARGEVALDMTLMGKPTEEIEEIIVQKALNKLDQFNQVQETGTVKPDQQKKAIQWLKDRGQPETPANIKAVIDNGKVK